MARTACICSTARNAYDALKEMDINEPDANNDLDLQDDPLDSTDDDDPPDDDSAAEHCEYVRDYYKTTISLNKKASYAL